MLILLELYREGGGWKRYSTIKRGVMGITPKMLSERLKELEETRLINRKVDHSNIPIKVKYELTEMGLDLIDVIKGFKSWAHRWIVENKVCASLDCSECTL